MVRSEPGTRRSWVRSLAATVAALLGLAAVFLVVFGTTQKQLQIGVLLGLWGGLIGAFLVFGSRRGQAEQASQLAEAERRARDLHEAQLQVSQLQQAQLAATDEARARQEVELRKLGDLQLSREVAARREADLHLELSLRREIERMMTEQIGLLRDEVAALRAEVVDKLGGQLRLERIETTRLIGSDLEALQHEIRRLAGQEGIGSGPSQLAGGISTVPVGRADIVDAEVVDAEEMAAPYRAPAPAAGSAMAQAPGAQAYPTADSSAAGRRDATPAERQPSAPPAWSEPTVVRAEPPSRAGYQPADRREPARMSEPFDLFAGLPRLSPLPADIELIPDPPVEPSTSDSDPPSGRRRASEEHEASAAGYHGRRRAGDEQDESPPAMSGGRRRAPDDAPDDLLARLRRS